MPDWCDEEGFIERLKQGDPAAQEQLIQNHSHKVWKEILRSLRRRNLPVEYAEEIAQDTWETVFGLIGSFEAGEDPCEIKHWIRRISFNHVRSTAKRHQKLVLLLSLDQDELESRLATYSTDTDEIGNPETELIFKEERAYISKVLCQCLTARNIEILRRWTNGEKRKVIAADYGIKPETVTKIIHRAFETIQNQLKLNGKG